MTLPHSHPCVVREYAAWVAAPFYVNPALPDWLPAVTIHNLRAGGGALDLVLRDGEVEVPTNTTRFEVIHGHTPRPKAPEVPG